MRVRSTKSWKGHDCVRQARIFRDSGGTYVVEVEGMGRVSPIEWHMFGFKVEEAVSEERELLGRSAYHDHGRMMFGIHQGE